MKGGPSSTLQNSLQVQVLTCLQSPAPMWPVPSLTNAASEFLLLLCPTRVLSVIFTVMGLMGLEVRLPPAPPVDGLYFRTRNSV